MSGALGDMWHAVLEVVPTTLAFVAILAAGYLLARLVRAGVAGVLHRVGLHRAVNRSGVARVLGSGVDAADLGATIAFYAVLLAVLQFGFGIWGPNPVSDLIAALVGWLPDAFAAILIVVVAAAISRAARDLLGEALDGVRHGRVVARTVSVLILGVGVVAAMDQARIATTITGPVVVAVLATVAGVIVVGLGGGLIRPLQQRSAHWLATAGTESRAIREQARSYVAKRAAEAEASRRAAAERAAREQAAEAARAAAADRARAAETARRAAEGAAAERAAAERAAAERAAGERAAGERAAAQRIAAERAAPISADGASRREEAQLVAPHDDALHIVPGFDRLEDDDGWHMVPGFDRFDDDIDRTQVLPPAADETQVIPRPDEQTGTGRWPRLRRRPRP